jgi:hypothetical protein
MVRMTIAERRYIEGFPNGKDDTIISQVYTEFRLAIIENIQRSKLRGKVNEK